MEKIRNFNVLTFQSYVSFASTHQVYLPKFTTSDSSSISQELLQPTQPDLDYAKHQPTTGHWLQYSSHTWWHSGYLPSEESPSSLLCAIIPIDNPSGVAGVSGTDWGWTSVPAAPSSCLMRMSASLRLSAPSAIVTPLVSQGDFTSWLQWSKIYVKLIHIL